MFAQNIKLLLDLYKEHKKQIFKTKLMFLIIINIIFFLYLLIEFNNPIFLKKINIESTFLDKGISILGSIIGYNLFGLNIMQYKLLIIFFIIIILNIIIFYFSTVLFTGFLIYLAKLWYKIQTNLLINHENMKILDINFTYLLSDREKKDLLDFYILKNNIKLDVNVYSQILDSILQLNNKKDINIEIESLITEYLAKIKLQSHTLLNTIGDSVVGFTEYLNKLDTIGIIKGIAIVGTVIVVIYCGHSLYLNSLNKSKEMSEAILDANKKTADIFSTTLGKTNEQIIDLNNGQIELHEHSLKFEEEVVLAIRDLNCKHDSLKEGITQNLE
jgi:hypothetical protein